MRASVILRRNTPPIFKLGTQGLDFVRQPIVPSVEGDLRNSILSWRNAGFDLSDKQGMTEPVGIIPPICGKFLEINYCRERHSFSRSFGLPTV